MSNQHILLTTIGAGTLYGETSYSFDGKQSGKTRFFTYALVEYLRTHDPVDEVVILLTKQATTDKNWQGDQDNDEPGLRALLQNQGLKLTECPIPDGMSEAEIWSIFDEIGRRVPQTARLTLDVTHGFRSIPLIMLLSVAYLRLTKSLDLRAIYYGAYAAKKSPNVPTSEEIVAPVFDLSPFLTLLDWSNAVDTFKRSGGLKQASRLLRERQRSLFKSQPQQGNDLPTRFISMATSMDKLTDALDLGRLNDLAAPIAEIERSVNDIRQSAGRWSKPFAAQVDLVLDAIKPLKQASASIENRLAAEFRLITWYQDHGYLVQAGLLLREWFISWYMSQQRDRYDVDTIFTNGGARDETASDLSSLTQTIIRQNNTLKVTLAVEGNQPIQVDETWNMLANLRNDLAHFGHRLDPLNAKAIRAHIDELIEKLGVLVKEDNE